MKFELTWKSFVAETPKVARRIGNALFGAGMAISGMAAVINHDSIAIGSAIAAAVGKFLTSFFSEDAPAPAAPPAPVVPEAPVQEPPK